MTSTQDRQSKPDAGPAGDADNQWSQAQLLFMKRAIAVMSTILILGFLLLIWRIMQLTGDDAMSVHGTPAGVSAPIIPSPVTLKAQAELALPPQSRIERIALSGRHLAVQYRSPNGEAVAIIDLTSGKVVARISITNSPGKG